MTRSFSLGVRSAPGLVKMFAISCGIFMVLRLQMLSLDLSTGYTDRALQKYPKSHTNRLTPVLLHLPVAPCNNSLDDPQYPGERKEYVSGECNAAAGLIGGLLGYILLRPLVEG